MNKYTLQTRKTFMKFLRSKGLTYREIANIIKVSYQRVHQILKNYDPGNDITARIKKVRCQICWSTNNLEKHRVDFNSHHNALENVIVVCRKCHRNIHSLFKNKGKVVK